MAQSRADRIRRIVDVQKQLHRAEEWRLGEIQVEVDRIETERHELIALLNSDAGLHGLFMDATVNRLRSLAEQAIQTDLHKQQQTQKVIEAGARLKAAERLFERAEREAEREAERMQLQEATERVSWQAPGKIVGR